MSACAVTSEIASVNDDANAPMIAVTIDLGATERLDATCGVDFVGNELDAVAGIDAKLSIGAR